MGVPIFPSPMNPTRAWLADEAAIEPEWIFISSSVSDKKIDDIQFHWDEFRKKNKVKCIHTWEIAMQAMRWDEELASFASDSGHVWRWSDLIFCYHEKEVERVKL